MAAFEKHTALLGIATSEARGGHISCKATVGMPLWANWMPTLVHTNAMRERLGTSTSWILLFCVAESFLWSRPGTCPVIDRTRLPLPCSISIVLCSIMSILSYIIFSQMALPRKEAANAAHHAMSSTTDTESNTTSLSKSPGTFHCALWLMMWV